MKISKLFHWLYALVMLLPIFAIGVTCGYAMFNKNAYQSYYGDTINEKNYTVINSFDDLEVNDEYEYVNQVVVFDTNLSNYIYIDNFELIESNFSYDIPTNVIGFRTTYYSNVSYTILRLDDNTDFRGINNANYSISFRFTYVSNNFDNVTLSDRFGTSILSISYNSLSFISEVFYYSIDKVKESPLFNWAYNSFLVTPFAYIVSLFSMPSNSFVVMLLSYWLAISIIWLVFDLVMYIPLLVHRWLDKGVLE